MASLRLSMMLRVASNSITRRFRSSCDNARSPGGEALKDSRGECGSRLVDETAVQGMGITGAAGSQQANALRCASIATQPGTAARVPKKQDRDSR